MEIVENEIHAMHNKQYPSNVKKKDINKENLLDLIQTRERE